MTNSQKCPDCNLNIDYNFLDELPLPTIKLWKCHCGMFAHCHNRCKHPTYGEFTMVVNDSCVECGEPDGIIITDDNIGAAHQLLLALGVEIVIADKD